MVHHHPAASVVATVVVVVVVLPAVRHLGVDRISWLDEGRVCVELGVGVGMGAVRKLDMNKQKETIYGWCPTALRLGWRCRGQHFCGMGLVFGVWDCTGAVATYQVKTKENKTQPHHHLLLAGWSGRCCVS